MEISSPRNKYLLDDRMVSYKVRNITVNHCELQISNHV